LAIENLGKHLHRATVERQQPQQHVFVGRVLFRVSC
jgi:hypothetical protein